MKAISKKFYLIAIFGGLSVISLLGVVETILFFLMVFAWKFAFPNLLSYGIGLGLTIFFMVSIFIYQIVVHFIVLNKMWQSIPPEDRRTTPGKAVGFSFIPVFHLYWRFKTLWGWAKDYNKYIARNNIVAPKMSEKMSLILPICKICGAILIFSIPFILHFKNDFFLSLTPAVRVLFAWVWQTILGSAFVLEIIFMIEGIDGANAIIASKNGENTEVVCTKGRGVKKIPKTFYLTSMIGGVFCGLVFLGIGIVSLVFFIISSSTPVMSAIQNGNISSMSTLYSMLIQSLPFMLIGIVSMIYAFVFWYILVYRIWDAIQFEGSRTTPARAVGFLFIPFFFYYWMFQAVWGWAKDYNAYIAKHKFNIPKMSEGFCLTISIVYLLISIPFFLPSFIDFSAITPWAIFVFIWAVFLVLGVLFIIFANKTINRVNALVEAPTYAQND